MKRTSVDNLINLTELNRVLRQAATAIWGRDDEFDYFSNGYMAVKIRLESIIPLKVLAPRFGGQLPPKGGALRSIKCKKDYTIDIIALDSMKKCLSTEADVAVEDTHLIYQSEYDTLLRVFLARGRDVQEYIFVDSQFLECINADSVVRAVKPERKSPVVFSRGDETAVVLPVNLLYKPGFLADL